jgi:predicted transcriptional regulator
MVRSIDEDRGRQSPLENVMSITLDPELEARLRELGEKQGTSPETLALNALRQRFLKLLEPQDEWERRLFEAATDCGVSPPLEAMTSEGLYD